MLLLRAAERSHAVARGRTCGRRARVRRRPAQQGDRGDRCRGSRSPCAAVIARRGVREAGAAGVAAGARRRRWAVLHPLLGGRRAAAARRRRDRAARSPVRAGAHALLVPLNLDQSPGAAELALASCVARCRRRCPLALLRGGRRREDRPAPRGREPPAPSRRRRGVSPRSALGGRCVAWLPLWRAVRLARLLRAARRVGRLARARRPALLVAAAAGARRWSSCWRLLRAAAGRDAVDRLGHRVVPAARGEFLVVHARRPAARVPKPSPNTRLFFTRVPSHVGFLTEAAPRCGCGIATPR